MSTVAVEQVNEAQLQAEIQRLRSQTERMQRYTAAMKQFSFVFVPAWFNVLSWILVVAAFRFVALKSGDTAVNIVSWISLMFLGNHLGAKIAQTELPGIPKGKTPRAASTSMIFCLIVTVPIAIICNVLANHLAIVMANWLQGSP